MTDEDWQGGVLKRLDHLEVGQQALSQRIGGVETKNAVDEVHRTNVEKRLSGIEDTLKWLVRLIIGAIILAAVTYALGGGFVR